MGSFPPFPPPPRPCPIRVVCLQQGDWKDLAAWVPCLGQPSPALLQAHREVGVFGSALPKEGPLPQEGRDVGSCARSLLPALVLAHVVLCECPVLWPGEARRWMEGK